jgi:hypothetical protein
MEEAVHPFEIFKTIFYFKISELRNVLFGAVEV